MGEDKIEQKEKGNELEVLDVKSELEYFEGLQNADWRIGKTP